MRDGVDVHQLNCTYYSALGRRRRPYVAARAIQLFARGVPQIYYVGLLAGENDQAAVARIGRGPGDQPARLHAATRSNARWRGRSSRRLLDLIRLRNTHDAFDGALTVTRWRWTASDVVDQGPHRATLDVDATAGTCVLGQPMAATG